MFLCLWAYRFVFTAQEWLEKGILFDNTSVILKSDRHVLLLWWWLL